MSYGRTPTGLLYDDIHLGDSAIRITQSPEGGVRVTVTEGELEACIPLPLDKATEVAAVIADLSLPATVEEVRPGALLVGDVIVDGLDDPSPATVLSTRLTERMSWEVEVETCLTRGRFFCSDSSLFSVRLPREGKA